MIRIYFLVILAAVFFCNVKAQQSVLGINSAISVDSINFLLSHEETDTIKIRLLNTLADKYFHLQKIDSIFLYAQQALDLSVKSHYLKGEFESRKWWPIVLRTKGDYVHALKFALQNLGTAEKTKDTFVILIGLHGVARTYNEMKDYPNQLKYNRRSKQIINSGYFNQEKDLKFKRLSFYLVMMGDAFQNLNQLDSALYYLREAYNTAIYLDQSESIAITTANLGEIYFKSGKYDSSYFHYREAIRYVEKLHTRYDLTGQAQLGLANIFEKRNQTDSAVYFGKRSLFTNLNAGYPLGELEAAKFLNRIYAKNNQMDSAYKYLILTYSLKDSLYNQEKTKEIEEVKYNDALKRQQSEQEKREAQQRYETRLKLSGLIFGLGVLLLVAFFLYRNNKQKQKANVVLHQKNAEIDKQRTKAEHALTELKATQAQLIQSEKMSSLGELTAGIAHEIQNPLNFVNNFSEVSNEMIDEMKTELATGNQQLANKISDEIKQNLEKILHHGKRADAIVKSMLQHSRQTTGVKEPTDLNALCDEYLQLAYHGMRAKEKNFNAELKTDFDEGIGKINIVPQDIGRVLLNLFNNAFFAVNEKKKLSDAGYQPLVSVQTKKLSDKAEIKVSDNGKGISQTIIHKIFQPFFTTKPTGQGTGLGLSLAYDIVTKEHNGTIKVESIEGERTIFIIQLFR